MISVVHSNSAYVVGGSPSGVAQDSAQSSDSTSGAIAVAIGEIDRPMAVLTSHDGSVMPMVADLSMRLHRPCCNHGDRRAVSRLELISLAFR